MGKLVKGNSYQMTMRRPENDPIFRHEKEVAGNIPAIRHSRSWKL